MGEMSSRMYSAAATAKKRTANKTRTREHAESSTSVEPTVASNRKAKAQRSSQASSSRGHNSGADGSDQHNQQMAVQPNGSESAEQQEDMKKQQPTKEESSRSDE